MVKTISEHIRMCEKRAAECRATAAASLDPLLNRELLDMEQRWLNIARSYAFFRDLEDYLLDTQLWFESFQNWQSEFLSTAVLVVLSIFLRHKGSSESKPVGAANSDTGE